MADETTVTEIDKRMGICPACEKLGYGQNYRCTERPNRGHIECRPVSQDAFADAHRKMLTAPKGEWIEVMHSSGNMIMVKGLGFDDGNALRFSMPASMKARENFVHNVSQGYQDVYLKDDEGEILESTVALKAPRKNWDKTYVPEKTVTYTDPKSGNARTFQLGGGTPLDELKEKFPEIYNSKSGGSTKSRANGDDDQVFEDDEAWTADTDAELDAADKKEVKAQHKAESSREGRAAEGLSGAIETDDLQALADEVEGEGAYSEEEEVEASYSATATADDVLDDIDEEYDEEKKPGKSRGKTPLRSAVESDHQQSLSIKAPKGGTAVKGQVFKFMDAEGNEETRYKVQHPTTNRIEWLREGLNNIDGVTIELKLV